MFTVIVKPRQLLPGRQIIPGQPQCLLSGEHSFIQPGAFFQCMTKIQVRGGVIRTKTAVLFFQRVIKRHRSGKMLVVIHRGKTASAAKDIDRGQADPCRGTNLKSVRVEPAPGTHKHPRFEAAPRDR
jgi:hypothetical protein